MTKDFIIRVSSDCPDPPGNKNNQFTVQLANTIKFHSNWRLGLSRIQYPRSWVTLLEQYIEIFLKNGQIKRIEIIPNAPRSTKELTELLNSLIGSKKRKRTARIEVYESPQFEERFYEKSHLRSSAKTLPKDDIEIAKHQSKWTNVNQVLFDKKEFEEQYPHQVGELALVAISKSGFQKKNETREEYFQRISNEIDEMMKIPFPEGNVLPVDDQPEKTSTAILDAIHNEKSEPLSLPDPITLKREIESMKKQLKESKNELEKNEIENKIKDLENTLVRVAVRLVGNQKIDENFSDYYNRIKNEIDKIEKINQPFETENLTTQVDFTIKKDYERKKTKRIFDVEPYIFEEAPMLPQPEALVGQDLLRRRKQKIKEASTQTSEPEKTITPYVNISNSQLNFAFDENIQRFIINTDSSLIESVIISDQLKYILGFDDLPILHTTIAKYPPNLKGHISSIYVYLTKNIIQDSINSNRMAPVLQTFAVSGTDGEMVENVFIAPEYHRVLQKEISQLSFEIKSSDNRLVPFSWGTVTLTLKFLKDSLL